MACTLSSQAIVIYVDPDYRYKLVATQITRVTDLTPIPYCGRKPHRGPEIEPAPHHVLRAQRSKP